MITIRHIYDEKQAEISQKTGLDCSKSPSLTKQSDRDAADINKITARYEKGGSVLSDLMRSEPGRYGDFSEVPDYQAAQNLVLIANEQFMALDANLRRRFNNDPAQFLDFATDSANIPEMIKLGLATEAKPTPPSQPVPAAPVAAPAGGAS